MSKQVKLTAEDRAAFLLNAYFGDVSDPLHTAVDSAYLDLCRTIEFKRAKSITDNQKAELRGEAVRIIESSVVSLGKKDMIDQEIFDKWHTELCRGIVKIYNDAAVPFYYGQAQKWVNMALKYLSVIRPEATAGYFEFLHVPVDSKVIETAADDFGVNAPTARWSRMDESQYLDYQGRLRSAINANTDLCPMLWEFRNWER